MDNEIREALESLVEGQSLEWIEGYALGLVDSVKAFTDDPSERGIIVQTLAASFLAEYIVEKRSEQNDGENAS